jgi:hypothetical protein
MVVQMDAHAVATDEMGNRINTKAWALAKDVWAFLRGRVAKDPALEQAVDDLATAGEITGIGPIPRG